MVFSLFFQRMNPKPTIQTSRHHYTQRSILLPPQGLSAHCHTGSTHPRPREWEASLQITAINIMYINIRAWFSQQDNLQGLVGRTGRPECFLQRGGEPLVVQDEAMGAPEVLGTRRGGGDHQHLSCSRASREHQLLQSLELQEMQLHFQHTGICRAFGSPHGCISTAKPEATPVPSTSPGRDQAPAGGRPVIFAIIKALISWPHTPISGFSSPPGARTSSSSHSILFFPSSLEGFIHFF